MTATIAISNKTKQTAVLATTDFDAKYKTGTGKHTQNTVQVISNGGFLPGQSIGVDGKQSHNVVVRLAVPCNDLKVAHLVAKVTVHERQKTFTAADEFVSGTTSIPAAGIGGVALAVLIGVGLIAMLVRRRGTAT